MLIPHKASDSVCMCLSPERMNVSFLLPFCGLLIMNAID